MEKPIRRFPYYWGYMSYELNLGWGGPMGLYKVLGGTY